MKIHWPLAKRSTVDRLNKRLGEAYMEIGALKARLDRINFQIRQAAINARLKK